jgi:hypothetical protein
MKTHTEGGGREGAVRFKVAGEGGDKLIEGGNELFG